MAIEIPRNDSFYRIHGQRCMQFVRSSPVSRTDCPLGPREQINQISSYLDGSMVYGSTLAEQSTLRSFRSGKPFFTTFTFTSQIEQPVKINNNIFTQLHTSFFSGMLKYTVLRHRKPLLPRLTDPQEDECRATSRNLHCFLAGDRRANEHPGTAQRLLLSYYFETTFMTTYLQIFDVDTLFYLFS